MDNQILLNILFQNGMENVVALAVQLSAGISTVNYQIGDNIIVETTNNSIKSTGFKFKSSGRSWGYYSCPIVAINEYRLEEKYYVLLPNGDKKWVKLNSNEASELEPIEEHQAEKQ